MRWYIRVLWWLGGLVVGLSLWMGLTGRKLYANVTVSLPPGLYVCRAVSATEPLKRGDIVQLLPPEAVRRAYSTLAPTEPQTRYWLKQVADCTTDAVIVRGTHPQSYDSRSFGPLPRTAVVGICQAVWITGKDETDAR